MTSQLHRRERYLAVLRQRVLAGRDTLTAALAKMLGLPFDQDAALLEADGRAGRSDEPTLSELRAMRERFMQTAGAVH